MTALSNSLVISECPSLHFSSGSSSKLADQCMRASNLDFSIKGIRKSSAQKRTLIVQASYSDGRRSSSASVFLGGFILGGLIAGTLGCVYAPQISKALVGTAKKELTRKLPKFIYDEEKVLEKQRKKLAEKIEEINAAIDNVSNQLQSGETSNGPAVSSDDVEAVV